jgi:glycosyltransferase involved in cell wall biosynthesis
LPTRRVEPRIVSFHGEIDCVRPGGLLGRTVADADWVTGCTNHVLTAVRGAVPDVVGRSSVVLCGLDPAFAGEPPEPPAGPPVLLCSGRMVREKGMHVLVDAMGHLAHREARLVLVGDGPERGALEAAAGDRVMFTGWVATEAVHKLAARATVVIVPSLAEGFGLVALEGSQMARPVIASDTGGLPEVIQDGVTGLLVPPGDPRRLAAAIDRLLDAPDLARALGRAGRGRALTDFGGERHIDEWDALYARVGAA